jgi:quercetin dioxygenase-like cupin family protein
MKQLLLAVAFAATFGSIECVTAQEAGDVPAVPTAKAPFHLPAFQNDYVTLLNVYIPPGRNTGYHAHALDMLTVIVEDSDTTGQIPGSPLGLVAHAPRGTLNFSAYSKQPQTHKVTNVGITPFHIVALEFVSPQLGRSTPSSRADVPGYALIMDNERFRAWRLALEPGQSVAAITQQAPGIRVVVDGGELVEIVPGQPERAMAPKLGEFFWQEPGVTRAIRNTGTSRMDLVEIELK